MKQIVAECLHCDSQFTEEEIKTANCCPNCKTTSLPIDPKHNIMVKINIHELRILLIWAENYAVSIDNKNLDTPNYESLKDTVLSIARRLRENSPEEFRKFIKTLSEEIQDLSKTIGLDVTLIRDGKEEV